ncbi:Hypothetical protein HDN1F_14660 [gamma proteobacterium HdN1]|nr:Hypothetical protein HDN1F_14660 [gamma proteobacterium HdN1]
MSHERIQAQLQQLKEELDRDSTLNDQQREELVALAEKLELMMSGELDRPEQELLERLEQEVVLYEQEHPVLANVIDNVLNLLHSIGI